MSFFILLKQKHWLMRSSLIYCLVGLLNPSLGLSLVDYSPSSSFSSNDSGVKIPENIKNNGRPSSQSSLQQGSFGDSPRKFSPKFVELSSQYDHLKMSSGTRGSVDRYVFGLFLKPIPDLYLDLSYWQGISDETFNGKKNSSLQAGNPKFLIGLTWLQFGVAEERTAVDIYAGASLKASKTTLGSSRDDKIAGFQTSKRFNSFIVGIGGELRLTGRPHQQVEDSETGLRELGMGNIFKLTVGLGWIVSSDIRISLESSSYRIKASDREGDGHELRKDLSFSTLSPKLYLGLLPSTELMLGLHVRTKAYDPNHRLEDARLYEFPGIYGSSFLIGLNLSV